MPKAKRNGTIDVSGDVDDRGRLVNKDIPEDARRSAKKGKKRKDTRKERVTELIVAEEEGTKRKKRRKKVDEEEVVVKKKRSKEPKPATDKALAKLERRREKALAEIDYLPAAMPGDEFDHQYRGMFDNLKVICGLFEEKMMDSPNSRDVYALSTLYSQMREVIADIRSAKDVSQQIAELEAKAYSAFIKLIGQTYVDLFFKLQKDIRMYVKDLDAQAQLLASLQGACKDQGDKVQAGYQTMLERVRTVLM